MDVLLGGLDRLIAKKRDLKQAAMQQLLTGQTRLPGFHGEWEVLSFKELFNISEGARSLNPKRVVIRTRRYSSIPHLLKRAH